MPRHVLIAGLFHETHTFLTEETTRDDFQWVRGAELLERAGDGSPLGSALAAGNRLGWRWIPTIDCRAQPSGIVADEVFERYWSEWESHAAPALQEGIDAIFLVLHGAMVTRSFLDVEGELLRRVRQMRGAAQVPTFGVFDLHANFTAAMAAQADCLVAYRENPHHDAGAMAELAVERLEQALASGAIPRTYWRQVPIVWPPTGTSTSDSPMRDLEGLARQLEAAHPALVAVNVCAGFAYADTPDTGVSFTVVTTGDAAEAEHALDTLAQLAWELREQGVVRDTPVDELLQQLPQPGLTVIAEPSDNIGGGAPGDGTGLLRALVKHGVQRAAVALCDPAAVARLREVSPGTKIELELGGRGSMLDAGPLALEVELVRHGDGRFALEDPQSHLASMFGGTFDMGTCAVVRHAGITILLTSRKTPPFDLGQWRSQGIEPTELAVIGAKAAVAHRRAYEPIAARFWSADTPGPCRSDLTTFPYQQLRRPIFPLDGRLD